MKFEKKLMKLRKEKALSQEELAEKLNVTRQTISKWELGQTKPDAEKLGEIAKFFEVSTDELLNDSEDPIKSTDKTKKIDNTKRIVIIVLVLVLALLIILGWAIYSLFFGVIQGVNKQAKGMYGVVTNQIEQQMVDSNETKGFFNYLKGQISEDVNKNNEQYDNSVKKIEEQYNNESKKMVDEHEIYSHNHLFENLYSGLQSKFFTETAVKEVITSNQNKERKITVEYKNISAESSEELVSLIKKLTKKEYLLSYEKDSDGFINKMIIKEV